MTCPDCVSGLGYSKETGKCKTCSGTGWFCPNCSKNGADCTCDDPPTAKEDE